MSLTEEQLKNRRYSLGASEWSQILGTSPFGDAYRVYQLKTGGETANWTSKHVQDGNDAEEFVLTLAEKRLPLIPGSKVIGKQARIASAVHPFLTATLDGIADVEIDGHIVSAVVEAKTISTAMYNAVPEYYLVQVLAQMYCAGLYYGYLVVWSKKNSEFRSFLIRRADHEKMLEESLNKVVDFWYNNVQAGVAPEKKVVERSEEVTVSEDLLEEFLTAQEAEKTAKEQKDTAKGKIIEALGSPETYRAKDHRYQIDLTTTVSKRLNSEKLKAAHPEVAQPFYEESSSQRLTIKRIGLKTF